MKNDLCSGCFRTIDEIAEWSNASDDRQRLILAASAQRRTQHERATGLISN